jgi:hypothetical protein
MQRDGTLQRDAATAANTATVATSEDPLVDVPLGDEKIRLGGDFALKAWRSSPRVM